MAKIRPLSSGLARKAKDELFEVESRIPEDIEALRNWIKKQPHLKTPLDDQFLVTFLRGSKYSLERAKEKIENFFSVRQTLQDIMLKRDPSDAKNLELLRIGITSILPNPLGGGDGPRLTLIRPGIYDPKKYAFNEVIKMAGAVTDIMMVEDDNCIVSGTVGILDLANVTMDHFLQFDLSLMKKMTVLSQEGQPFRQKGFHYINAPSTFESIFNILKGFMSEKNKQRVFIHSTFESLYKHVPREYLPEEYGGFGGKLNEIAKDWEKKMMDKRDMLLEWDTYGTVEHLRLKKSKILEELYGLDGSFRKLAVD